MSGFLWGIFAPHNKIPCSVPRHDLCTVPHRGQQQNKSYNAKNKKSQRKKEMS